MSVIPERSPMCPWTSNPLQHDCDEDGQGDGRKEDGREKNGRQEKNHKENDRQEGPEKRALGD